MRVQLAQINTTVGDLIGNTEKITRVAMKTHNEYDNGIIDNNWKTTLIIYPELTITGYPPLDLIDNSHFINDQLRCLDKIVKDTKHIYSPLFVGYIDKNSGPGKGLYNAVAVIYRGEIVYKYYKRLLPTYDIFDEARYFEPGKEIGLWSFQGSRIGIAICEDLWYNNKLYSINPAKDLFHAKADCILSINASPSVVKKQAYRTKMIASISEQYSMPIYYVNQVGGNDDIVFDGNSFATNSNGVIISSSVSFTEDTSIIAYNKKDSYSNMFHYNKFESDAQFYYEQAAYGIKEYVNKNGFKDVVIGESGGIDSALVTALAVSALGKDRVVGITMPTDYSSEGSVSDSEKLCDNFGVKCYKFPIGEYFNNLTHTFNGIFDIKKSLMEENLQPRIRGQILLAFSNRFGHLVLTTGNKSELSVGYCTIYGDMAGGLAPISDLYKMEVYAVAKYINEKIYKSFMIPEAILLKAPSAELSPDQKDSDSLPPYPILDSILKLIIEGEVLDPEEKAFCEEVTKEYPDHTKRVLELVSKSEFKRRQAAIGLKMHRKSFGFGRRMPIVQKWPISL